jgi:outer membrane protein OmpA-like peptidoglycan-associated protein
VNLTQKLSMFFAVGAAAGSALMAPATAHAQSTSTEFSVERFRLSSDRQGILDVEWGEVLPSWSWELNAWMGYANDPLILRNTDGSQVQTLIARRIGGEVGGSLSLTNWLGIAVHAPLILNQKGPAQGLSMTKPDSVGLGDVRALIKIELLRGIALMPAMTFPTSGSTDYFGSQKITFEPELVLSTRLGGVRLAANVGAALRKQVKLLDLTVGNELYARAGIGLPLGDSLELGLTGSASSALKKPFDRKNQNGIEAFLGLQAKLGDNAMLFLGGGAGLRRGYGTPDWRALAGVRIFSGEDEPTVRRETPVEPEKDLDGDGIIGATDKCPNDPENFNEVEDTDGCPDQVGDTDKDGIADNKDKCLTEPEDIDGFQEDDGCPDPDNDNDNVLDINDKCPLQPGVINNQGCPDPDRDGDTVVDRLDNCPDEPGEPKNAGCKGKQLVSIVAGKLDILDKVYFQTSKAVILGKSYPLLNNVADVIKSHPEIGVVRVEGHTDSRGNDASNKSLSQKRADSVVKYLVARGVDRARLEAVGFGEDKPIADNSTDEGRSANRRVDFVITGDGAGVQNQNSGPGADTMDKK